ncbi:hypothetical protein [Chryseobacterium carnipullorum]|uniref:Uncharacterized protein n=1 Tax=Chryseobacterium carnipullorum TaxID=1124835 RepID=A0A376DSM0_CHRCU|nr:hypothetical protein [Chryseobacterium carnipullorum]STC94907.1 Uncharacterised protein [Chryseobacterium carnipullorum]
MNPQEERKMIKLNAEDVKRILGFKKLSSLYDLNFKSKESLESISDVLSMTDTAGLVKKGLEYFRNEYRCRPESYPGDYIFYDMFSGSMKKGFSFTESYDNWHSYYR